MDIIVKNCHDCPFANNDNEYGVDMCNLSELTKKPIRVNIRVGKWERLPHDKVHEDCPIVNDNIKVIIVKNNKQNDKN